LQTALKHNEQKDVQAANVKKIRTEAGFDFKSVALTYTEVKYFIAPFVSSFFNATLSYYYQIQNYLTRFQQKKKMVLFRE
jgi:hypothetical protein